ncbi:MAG: flippase-like domain-containing protein [Anaerolineaceae bacterium]|nr:flippase-like domain-containing protein [Anaerolineaceae bacterium]
MAESGKSGWLGKALRWLVPLTFSGVAFWLIFRQIEFSQLFENLKKVGWGTILLAIVFYYLSYFTRVFCWYLLLRRKVPFWETFFTMSAGYLLNNIFPFRLGEIGRAILLDDPERSPALEVFSSILVERVFDVFLAAVFILSMLPRVIGNTFDQRIILIALVVAVVGLLALFFAARFREKINAWLERWGERSKFIQQWVTPKAVQLLEGLSVLNKPGLFLLAFGSLAISWFLSFGENYVVFNSLHPQPPFWWMVFVLSAGAFGGALPSVPAGLGVFEGVMVAAFALLGVDAGTAFTHAIVIHAMAFLFTNVMGLIGLRLRGQAVVDLYHRAVNRPKEQNISG